jgi:hypothetical protein
LARASVTTERTVKLFPQPGPPVSTATREVSASRGKQAEEGGGQGTFSHQERRQVDGGDQGRGARPGRDILPDHPLGRGQFVQARGDQLGRHIEDLGRVGQQVGRGQVAVPLVGRLGQGEGQPGLDPLRAIPGDADRGGDGVRGLETDAPHVGG